MPTAVAAGVNWSVLLAVVAICVTIMGGALVVAFALGSFRQEVRDSLKDLFRRLGRVETTLENRTFEGQMSANGHLSGHLDSHESTA